MAPIATAPAVTIDLSTSSTRQINQLLASPEAPRALRIANPLGAHAPTRLHRNVLGVTYLIGGMSAERRPTAPSFAA